MIIFLGLIMHLPTAWNGGSFIGIAEIILVTFCAGWLIFATARWVSRFDGRFASAYRRPALAEAASTCLVFAAAVVATFADRVFGNWAIPFGFDLTYAPLWGSFSLAALAGTLVTYPLHLWLLRRGVIRWGVMAIAREDTSRELAWYQQAAVLFLALAVTFVAVLWLIRSA